MSPNLEGKLQKAYMNTKTDDEFKKLCQEEIKKYMKEQKNAQNEWIQKEERKYENDKKQNEGNLYHNIEDKQEFSKFKNQLSQYGKKLNETKSQFGAKFNEIEQSRTSSRMKLEKLIKRINHNGLRSSSSKALDPESENNEIQKKNV